MPAVSRPPDPGTLDRLSALLTYGDPYAGPSDGAALVVSPRLGTVSPWASKASDIAHNCGLDVRRIERIVEYRISLKSGLLGKAALAADQLAAMAALLHDRMTESVMPARAEAHRLFTELQAAPMERVDVLEGGRAVAVGRDERRGECDCRIGRHAFEARLHERVGVDP